MTAKLRCYVCGEPLGEPFCLATMADETDRVFTVHGKCGKQLDQKETALISVLVIMPLEHRSARATQLRFAQHTHHASEGVCEVWHKGEFVAQVTGADVAGVRIVSRYDLTPLFITDGIIQIVEVRIGSST
jgi:hypothetical protein